MCLGVDGMSNIFARPGFGLFGRCPLGHPPVSVALRLAPTLLALARDFSDGNLAPRRVLGSFGSWRIGDSADGAALRGPRLAIGPLSSVRCDFIFREPASPSPPERLVPASGPR